MESLFSDPILKDNNPAVVGKNNVKKRKHRNRLDKDTSTKKKKSTAPHLRRNIRPLYTEAKLQNDTLAAQKAEQERIQRLQETNCNRICQQQEQEQEQLQQTSNENNVGDACVNSLNLEQNNNKPLFYAQLNHGNLEYSTGEANIFPQKTLERKISSDDDCILIDDDDNDDDDSNEKIETIQKLNDTNNVGEISSDDSDSDIQCVTSDTENVNDTLSKKLQRLHIDDRMNIPDENGLILVNVNHPGEDNDLYIPKHLTLTLKPHQIGGIRFMYDNIVESIEQHKKTDGLGCILAHSMGCGKTIQVIAFIDTLLRHTVAKCVLIVVPINTIQNWVNEFKRWTPEELIINDYVYKRPFSLYILNEIAKKLEHRAKIIQNWSVNGGVLILGYEMFRLMVTRKGANARGTNKKKRNNNLHIQQPVFVDLEEEKNVDALNDVRNALLSPDLIICHRIKNHLAGVAQALKEVKTHRRIVLTGYPLQNNLLEYWCMVDFVRPNYLGSRKEFSNMFERPIMNGQCVDSTIEDVKLMKYRAHVLHSILEGFVQRRGHDVLQSALPPKDEYVILLKLSTVQRQLYVKFLNAIGALSYSEKLNPLRAFAICCKIWNHADVLYKFIKNRQEGSDLDLDIDLELNNTKSTTRQQRLNRNSINSQSSFSLTGDQQQMTTFSMEKKEFDYDFANTVFNSYMCGLFSSGIKFEVAFTLLDLSIELGDKVLVFSQSLLSLNIFEEFLYQRRIPKSNDQVWEKNKTYLRLDGSTSSLDREKLINIFNAPNSNAKLFLLSTRAGCLGINLIAASRVIVLDVSWNPCHDAQAVCRVYRYGQKKHCYIYRLIADYTMEKRIYDRQIAKQGMSDRVVDELQPQSQFTKNEVENLVMFAAEEESSVNDISDIEKVSNDDVLLNMCQKHIQSITKVPFTHESLLCDKKDNQLTSADKRRAQRDYQHQKRMHTTSYKQRLTIGQNLSYQARNTPFSYSNYLNTDNRIFNQSSSSSLSSSTTLDTRFPLLNNCGQQRLSSSFMTPLSIHSQQTSTSQKLDELKYSGMNIQQSILRSPLIVQIEARKQQIIPANTQVQYIQTSNGSYIRTPEGKFFAIRSPQSTEEQEQQQQQRLPPSSLFDDSFDSNPTISSSSSSSSTLLPQSSIITNFQTQPLSTFSDINVDSLYFPYNNSLTDLNEQDNFNFIDNIQAGTINNVDSTSDPLSSFWDNDFFPNTNNDNNFASSPLLDCSDLFDNFFGTSDLESADIYQKTLANNNIYNSTALSASTSL
ncbi:unnamed protein product [Didymodactylos carnosus]|uniref:Helicase ARIP4-like n=1 Tax=Didymodactylos carnosus TaxID=1234261 RepID=A0A814RYF7_9BILA|nr:unnamed protein product [Didymodactylos carnosus]CAF1140398.1 unnamed protein product [Didymodactylos carnosus]CAF3558015.1 unnamed protein product [Didymodactylos carnosus]CAF3904088.1 unnamed protein product [Didymodactylos carnosus]